MWWREAPRPTLPRPFYGLTPFEELPRRLRTGTTPPPPISPLGSPPELTPVLRTPDKDPYSPQKYPIHVPVFNVRPVETPPRILLSPFYGHSTPLDPQPLCPKGGFSTPRRKKRWYNQILRDDAFKKLPADEKFYLGSPILHRQDADSCFEEDLVPFVSIAETPPQSPKYERRKTPARSPAVLLMQEEMKKKDDRRKYFTWFFENVGKAASRDIVLEGIVGTLHMFYPGIDLKKMNVREAVALLSDYLKRITEKLLTQNLELPALPSNNPALSLVEQKKISIRRIIGEYKKQNEELEKKVRSTKDKVVAKDYPGRREGSLKRQAEYKEKIEGLAVEKRMERIVAWKGLCIQGCPTGNMKQRYDWLNEALQKEVDELRLQIVELESECMEAMADTTQFVDVVSPNFLKNLAAFIRTLHIGGKRFEWSKPVPQEAYDEAAKDLSKHLRRIFKHKRQEFVDANREVNALYPMIKEKYIELDGIKTKIENCKMENLKLRAEFNKIKTHSQNIEWMIKDAQGMLNYYEQEYASAYQTLKEEKQTTVELEAQLGTTPTGPPEMRTSPEREPPRTSSPIITLPKSPTAVASPPEEGMGPPVHASSPDFASSQAQQDTPFTADFLGREQPPSAMLNISGLSPGEDSFVSERTLQAPAESDDLMDFSGLQGGESFLEDSASSCKKTVLIPSPGKMEQLRMDVEIIPQDIRRSPSGQRVVCDVAVQMQEATLRPPRRIEKRYKVVRGTPPISQTVGRRVDRRHGMFTPSSIIRRGYVGVRRPLFAGDFESPEPPFGTGRKTHPELMNLPQRPPSPRPPRLDTTIEWENPEMNTAFRG